MTPTAEYPIAQTDVQQAALEAWENDAALSYARPDGKAGATFEVAPDAESIRSAEAAGWVAPDPITFMRRNLLLGDD